ncbi:FtsX-like permease family protein [uncultured Sphingomonas sp.]|uniref:ABC transporter permease n=1 Tax=uncultured Sphingomonas sp. TaxID=158754 RepID=UPI0025F76EA8|nr:FtsX-like permease family protein [uncultured Sphingomonas sp.]
MSPAALWRIARRDLNAGFRGLRLLFVCLFLGVVTLATIGSLTVSISSELTARGRVILGGDVEVAMTQRQAPPAVVAAMREGAMGFSSTIRLRAMANGPARAGTPGAVLTELKGVDGAYPLTGTLRLASGRYAPLAPDTVVVDRALAERLLLRVGDPLRYGTATFRVAGIIAEEPDRVSEGFTLGPVAIVSLDGLRRTGLVQPGAMYEAKYRLTLPAAVSPAAVVDRLKAGFPAEALEIKTRDRAAPGADRFFQRLGQFLGLIGLAALVIAGIGVGNGVGAYLIAKRGGIATLKVLGATSRDIERLYLMQIGAVSLAAVVSGLVVGAALPAVIVALVGDLLPVKPAVGLHLLPLATSAAFGLLIAYAFALPPLARARSMPAAALFREGVERRGGIEWRTALRVGVAAAAIVALAVGTARDPLFAAVVLGSVAGVLLLLAGLGWAIRRLAARVPRPKAPLVRLAVANLHRPGAQTGALVVALGLALTLFVTLAAIQTSLDAEIARAVPARAPDQFVLDVPSDQRARFEALVKADAPEAKLNIVPSLRGTIVAYAGTRVADLKAIPDDAWFLRGERGVTYSASLPQGSVLSAGKWWPADYAGPPLVSLDREAAKTLGLKVGDTMTVSVLGREIEARIANLREIHWETLGFNYIMVFSPNTLAAAPHSLTATIEMDDAHQGAVTRALLAAFPSASIIATREIIGQVRTILDQMAAAILLSASVAILAGIAVLVGAIAASRAARTYDSTILKTLGATRGQVLGAQGIEYALLAGVLAVLALGLGGGAAWFVIVRVFDFGWAPDWGVVLGTLGAGAFLTLGIGLAGSWPVLSARPAAVLRRL